MKLRYTLKELQGMKTLSVSQFGNLKIEDVGASGKPRLVWLSRMTVEDGAKYDNQVTVEVYDGGQWKTTAQYQAE